MTPQEAAALLDGREYRQETSREERALFQHSGLVVIYGASDDLMEIEGAVDDEIGVDGGGEALFTSAGILKSECEDDDCPYFEKEKAKAQLITALWDTGGFSWKYETEIPHAKFVIKEDGENYCEGIVFALADVKEPSA